MNLFKKVEMIKEALDSYKMKGAITPSKTVRPIATPKPKKINSFGVRQSGANVTSTMKRIPKSPSVGPDVMGLATKIGSDSMAGFLDEMEKNAVIGKVIGGTVKGVARATTGAGKLVGKSFKKYPIGTVIGGLGAVEVGRRGYQTLKKDQKITNPETMRKLKSSRAVLES
jgi:hypothetical protein